MIDYIDKLLSATSSGVSIALLTFGISAPVGITGARPALTFYFSNKVTKQLKTVKKKKSKHNKGFC